MTRLRRRAGRQAGRGLRLAHLAGVGLLAALVLAACAGWPATPPPQVEVTRVESLVTSTPTPLPPTGTPSPSPTATGTPTATPVPPTPTATVPPIVQLVAMGDVMLARSIGDRILSAGPEAVLAGAAGVLDGADLVVANLECTIAEAGTPEPKAYVFAAPPEAADALAAGGVSVVSLANNHALDLGRDGLADMLPRLAERGIGAVGAGPNAEAARAPLVVERNGVRLAFLAYVDVPVESRSGFDTRTWEAGPELAGVAWAREADIAADVAAAKTRADVVIVLLHFGLEGRPEVTPAQRSQARAAIDAGAALVIGSHPHVLQPVERYGNGLIVYSLGNFVFDGFTGAANDTALFVATLTPDGLAGYAFVPATVEQGLPRLATAEQATRILAQLRIP